MRSVSPDVIAEVRFVPPVIGPEWERIALRDRGPTTRIMQTAGVGVRVSVPNSGLREV
ncbi:MAG: hypothetical protein AB7O52_17805 [Planctomycetota bacterium]